MQIEALKLRWDKLFSSFQLEPSLIDRVFIDLATAYSSENRYYHNLLHIQDVLNIATTFESCAKNFTAIQIAAWFHDVIYDSKASDNEEKSAEYAFVTLNDLNISSSIINSVTDIILNTKHHTVSHTIDNQILLDADLSILGSEELKYNAYAQAIRKEYSWISDREYQIKRKRILRNFLERDRIYFLDKSFKMLETKARENITDEISNL